MEGLGEVQGAQHKGGRILGGGGGHTLSRFGVFICVWPYAALICGRRSRSAKAARSAEHPMPSPGRKGPPQPPLNRPTTAPHNRPTPSDTNMTTFFRVPRAAAESIPSSSTSRHSPPDTILRMQMDTSSGCKWNLAAFPPPHPPLSLSPPAPPPSLPLSRPFPALSRVLRCGSGPGGKERATRRPCFACRGKRSGTWQGLPLLLPPSSCLPPAALPSQAQEELQGWIPAP